MPLKCYFSKANASNQHFSLPLPLINYIYTNPYFHQNEGQKIYFALPKLNECCKYFFIKYKTLYLSNINVNGDKFYGAPLFKAVLSIKKLLQHSIEQRLKFCIAKRMVLNPYKHSYFTSNLFSTILSNTSLYYPMRLHLFNQNLTVKEFDHLASSPRLYWAFFTNLKVFYNDDTKMPVEQMLEKLVNVKKFQRVYDEFSNIYVTTETFQNLAKLKRKQQLTFFSLSGISHDVDSEAVVDFLKDHHSSDCDFNKNPNHFQLSFTPYYGYGLSSFHNKIFQNLNCKNINCCISMF